MGDAAHATTPHQGQGAGMAFEDSLVLSNILGQVLGKTTSTAASASGKGKAKASTFHQEIESCFHAYDEVRRVRTQKLTSTSREMGEIIGFVGEGIGRDFAKIKANLDTRMDWIWNVDLPQEIMRGVRLANTLLTRCSQ
jgi:salicylate hydroxylase